jgi:hypothetical protein
MPESEVGADDEFDDPNKLDDDVLVAVDMRDNRSIHSAVPPNILLRFLPGGAAVAESDAPAAAAVAEAGKTSSYDGTGVVTDGGKVGHINPKPDMVRKSKSTRT